MNGAAKALAIAERRASRGMWLPDIVHALTYQERQERLSRLIDMRKRVARRRSPRTLRVLRSASEAA